MNEKVNLIAKTVLSLSVVMAASSSFAQMTLEQQVATLQKQVQELQTLMQQQQNNHASMQQNLNTAVIAAPALPEGAKKEWNKLSSKNGAALEIYGNIRADASYQSKGPDTIYNKISALPLDDTADVKKNSDRFQSTLNATRLGFNFKAPTMGAHNLGGKVEMDFFGGSGRDTFRIRHAYITLDQWLIGQTWSNFNAIENYPETVDASLSVGGSLTRVPQIKYNYAVDQNLSLALSLEDPKAETITTTGNETVKTDPYAKLKLPSFTGRVNYKFDTGSSFSGRAFLTQKTTAYANGDDFLAWGVGAGGKLQILPQTLVRLDYNHIKGDTKNVLWTNSAYALTLNGDMKPNELDTIAVGITQQFSPKIRGTFGFGYMRADDSNEFSKLVYADPAQNKQLAEAWINMFYSPYKPLNLGVEYMYGERKTFDNKTGEDNRLNLTAIYDF